MTDALTPEALDTIEADKAIKKARRAYDWIETWWVKDAVGDLIDLVQARQHVADGWERARWNELKADDEGTFESTGDTIRLSWEDGTILIGRLTVSSVGSGHQQVCRMQTRFGGDTYVFPHGAKLERRTPMLPSGTDPA